MLKILFLCHGNSCRSQIAEGWARHLKSGVLAPSSAGATAKGVDPLAVAAMREAGVDITDQTSKTLAGLEDKFFDYVITLCDTARNSCPVFPGRTRVVHRGFDDPPALVQNVNEEEALAVYRRVRDEIRDYVQGLPDSLPTRSDGPIPPPSFGPFS